MNIPPYSAPFVEILQGYQKLVARLLTFPMVTVAAINGMYQLILLEPMSFHIFILTLLILVHVHCSKKGIL